LPRQEALACVVDALKHAGMRVAAAAAVPPRLLVAVLAALVGGDAGGAAAWSAVVREGRAKALLCLAAAPPMRWADGGAALAGALERDAGDPTQVRKTPSWSRRLLSGQVEPFTALSTQECMGHLTSLGSS
jgi:hypothetical protein